MKCKNCGKEIPDNTGFCPECGANQGVDSQQPTKKKKKWWIAIIIVVVIIVLLIAFGNSGGNNDSGDNKAEQSSVSGETTQANVTVTKQEKPEGAIGDYIVTIKDSRITTDYEGKDVLVVTYSFTNNSDDSEAMIYAVSDKLFQNGVELGDVWSSYGIDDFSMDNQSKEIKPGVTLDVQIAYELNDTTTDVNVELSDILELSDPITYTISLK